MAWSADKKLVFEEAGLEDTPFSTYLWTTANIWMTNIAKPWTKVTKTPWF